MRLIVGAPVANRAWSLPRYFECLAAQTRRPDGFAFIHSGRPGDATWRTIVTETSRHGFDALDLWHNPAPPHQRHDDKRFATLATLRNELLEVVRDSIQADLFLSLDTDILLEDPRTIEQLEALILAERCDVAQPVTSCTTRPLHSGLPANRHAGPTTSGGSPSTRRRRRARWSALSRRRSPGARASRSTSRWRAGSGTAVRCGANTPPPVRRGHRVRAKPESGRGAVRGRYRPVRPACVVRNRSRARGSGGVIDVVCVDWETPQLAARCVGSLRSDLFTSIELVDAKSRGWSYAQSVNRSLARGNAPYVLALNADTRMLEPPDHILAIFEEHADIAVIGPRQINDQSLITHAGIVGTNTAPAAPLLDGAAARGRQPVRRGNLDSVTVSGSVYFARRSVWENSADSSTPGNITSRKRGCLTWHAIAGIESCTRGRQPGIHKFNQSPTSGGVARE